MNSVFKTIYDTVVVNTNRPHMQAETKNSIIGATQELHGRGRFVRDVREVILTSTNGGTCDYLFSIPTDKRIRELLNVYPLRSDGCKGINLERLGMFEQSHIPNWYKYNQFSLQIHTSQPAQMFALSYLSFPDLTETGFDSWIAITYPHMISDLATFKVLTMANKMDQARIYRASVGEANMPGSHVYTLLQENETIS